MKSRWLVSKSTYGCHKPHVVDKLSKTLDELHY